MNKNVLRGITAIILLLMVITPMSSVVMAGITPETSPMATLDIDTWLIYPEPTPLAIINPPEPSATYTIANESWFGMAWFQPADGDDITVNAGGIVHCNWNWTNAGVSLNGITVNLGAIFIQHNGTEIVISDTFKIQVNEGGQWRSLGTSLSRCAITWENVAS